MRTTSIAALIAAMAALGAPGVDRPPADKPALPDGTAYRMVDNGCACGTSYRTQREWELHRPSTPREREETGRLNREYLESSRAAAAASAPPPAPDAAQLAWQQQMKNYRALTESYERRMRDYNQLHAQADAAQTRYQDAGRADPWHGYSGRGNNGY